MRRIPANFRGLIEPAGGSDIRLHADDGLDSGLAGLAVELDRSAHVSMVGQGHRPHAHPGGLFKYFIDAHGPIKEGILAVDMQVSETRRIHLLADFSRDRPRS